MKRTYGKMADKRKVLKNLEILAKLLEVYIVGVLVNSTVISLYRAKIMNDDKAFDVLLVLIWSGVCISIFMIWRMSAKFRFVEINKTNGVRLFARDIGRCKSRLKRALCTLVTLIAISSKELLLFEEVFLMINVLEVLINLMLIKCFEDQKQGFIEKRRLV